jgi:primary-amine oxidase
MDNVICLHEQDDGIGWKHTNYRTNVAAVTRSRILIVQTIITVANYEYIFAWRFGQAADIHLEVRATGILSTQPIHKSLNEVGVPYGTVVHDQVLAAHHQHIFSMRIDPAIDGLRNTLVVEEAHPIPVGKENPFGNGFVVKKRVVDKPGYEDLDITKARVFKIVNESVKNPVNGGPTGYKIYPFASQVILLREMTYADAPSRSQLIPRSTRRIRRPRNLANQIQRWRTLLWW